MRRRNEFEDVNLGGPRASTSPVGREAEDARLENTLFLRENAEVLWDIHAALRFSGRSFLALGAAQLLFQGVIVASLDEFAFGIFLLDAANTVRRLAANMTRKPAADELCSAMRSVADTHSILGWVTSFQMVAIVSTFFGLRHYAESSETYHLLNDMAEGHPLLIIGLKCVIAVLSLKFGGLRYCRNKLDYWSRATNLGASLLADKVARLLGRRPEVRSKHRAKIL